MARLRAIAYAAHAAGVAVFDLSTPEAPRTLANLALPRGDGQLGSPIAVAHLARDGDTLFASTAGNANPDARRVPVAHAHSDASRIAHVDAHGHDWAIRDARTRRR